MAEAGRHPSGTGEPDDSDDGALLRRAADHDEAAWAKLVRRHSGVVWAVARHHGLRHADASDVYQNTWLALATSLGGIRDPSRLRYWLATTAARQATKVAESRRREFTRPDWEPIPAGDVWSSPEAALLTTERDCLLWQAFAALPRHCRSLLKLFAHAPELSYAQAAAVLAIPANSIGPRRGRCLSTLRRKVLAAGILEGTR